MKVDLIKKISELSDSYKEMVFNAALVFQREKDLDKVLTDWYLSLIFFFDRVFYQGRTDIVSGRFELATIQALDNYFQDRPSDHLGKLAKDGLLNWENYGFRKDLEPLEDKHSTRLHSLLVQKYDIIHEGKKVNSITGKQRDRAMVIDTLKFISTIKDYNILDYSIKEIKKGKIKKLDKDLRSIRQVGKKTCSLFLRDTVSFYELDESLSDSDYDVLQPVDTWVFQMAKKLGMIDKEMKLSELEKNRSLITEAANAAGVSPLSFNQGLWYLPTHAVDLLLDAYNISVNK